jgi:peptidyl-prolyl cis-trans isomerase D
MLQNIRDKAQGWIAWAIVILITIPFALWGIQEYLGVGSEPVVASVNGKEITERNLDRRFQQYRERLRDRLGSAYRPEMFDDKRLRKDVLQGMIREDVILQTSHDMGLRVGDPLIQHAILGMDLFKRDGQFNQQAFERAVRMQGMTPDGFAERIRQALLSDQLSRAVQGGSFVTEREIAEHVRLFNQTRKVEYFILPSADFETDEPISDGEIKDFYDAHQSDFRTPEQVKLAYLLLNADAIGETVEVDEDALLSFYENNQELYGRPEERRASHILIKLDEDADQAALTEALAEINGLKIRIEQGEDFAELAKTNSDDPGTAEEGGDLGWFGKGIMDPAFEAEVFALQEGQLSEPVRTPFGLHLIKLTGIKPDSVKPFEEVRAEVEKAYRKQEGERLYFEQAEKLADLSYEDPGSLEPAANALHLKVLESDWVAQNSAQGVLRHPKVLSAAFSEDVLLERHNSELLELDQLQSMVLRVVDYKEASVEPLAEVQERVTAMIRRERAEQKTREEAEKRLARLNEGAALAHVAGDYDVVAEDAVTRSAGSLPLPLQRKLFQTPRPQTDKPVSGMAVMNRGNIGIFTLYEVKDGSLENLDETHKQQMRASLRQGLSREHYESLVADLMERADVSILQKDEEN